MYNEREFFVYLGKIKDNKMNKIGWILLVVVSSFIIGGYGEATIHGTRQIEWHRWATSLICLIYAACKTYGFMKNPKDKNVIKSKGLVPKSRIHSLEE